MLDRCKDQSEDICGNLCTGQGGNTEALVAVQGCTFSESVC